jgi:HSP20 family molecular chaperone IbpA
MSYDLTFDTRVPLNHLTLLDNVWWTPRSRNAILNWYTSDRDGVCTVEIELPGIPRGDISVEADDETRQVTVNLKNDSDNRRMSLGTITKTFSFGNECDMSTLDARLESGILTLSVRQRERKRRASVIYNMQEMQCRVCVPSSDTIRSPHAAFPICLVDGALLQIEFD